MDSTELAFFAVAVSFIVSFFLLLLLLKYRSGYRLMQREIDQRGICVRVSDKKSEELKMEMGERFELIKEITQIYYMNCDDFFMHRESIARALDMIAKEKGIGALCKDIVTVSNICEGGAIDALTAQFNLSPGETRVCCFLYWGFKWQQTCTIEGISENAYFIKCSRIRKKLGLTKEEDIPTFLNSFMHSFVRL